MACQAANCEISSASSAELASWRARASSAERAAIDAEAREQRSIDLASAREAELQRCVSEQNHLVAELQQRARDSETERSKMIDAAAAAETDRLKTVQELSERVITLRAELHHAHMSSKIDLPRIHAERVRIASSRQACFLQFFTPRFCGACMNTC